MKQLVISIFIFISLLQSCSNIQIINEADIYSKDFLKKIESIQLIYKDGDKDLALRKLDAIDDNTITSAEMAKKYNLIGVMKYSMGATEEALEYFQKAKTYVREDLVLSNQISLNVASLYFKKEQIDSTLKNLKMVDVDYLTSKEKENYYRLKFIVANQLNDHSEVVNSVLFLTREISSYREFSDFKYKEILIDNFKKLADRERVSILEDHVNKSPYAIANLGRIEVLNRFYSGDREGAADVVNWLSRNLSRLKEVESFVSNYRFRMENYSKINSGSVGVVAPLTGRMSKYGYKVLEGINTSLGKSKSDFVSIHVKDNKNNPYLAQKMIQELVSKHHVSVIIGGLFPDLAKIEYLEARKYGVMYISLAPVHIPRAEKGHLLLELPGSIESQLDSLVRPEVLEKIGKRVAVLYPSTDDGKSYINEFWNLHNANKISLSNVYHYARGIKDYREPVKEILGLRFPRERQEEIKVWKEIKNLDKKNVRIINVLPPIIDFDWVFLPAFPSEALQIIPTFSYFDVKGVKFIGGPSWINQKLKSNRRDLAPMYVIGNDVSSEGEEFSKYYKSKTGKLPHLVDTLSYEGMEIVLNLVKGQNFKERQDLDSRILKAGKLKGLTSEWLFKNGLWIKNMDILGIYSGGFKKLDYSAI